MEKTVWWNVGVYAGLTLAAHSDAAAVTVDVSDSSPIDLGSVVWVLPKLDGKTTSMALSVNGVPGGNAAFGIIDERNGLYMAPSVMPPGGMVVLMATTRTEPKRSGSVALTFKAAAPAVPDASSCARLSAAAAIHLLEQATFGPTDEEITRLRRMGTLAWLQEQFSLRASPVVGDDREAGRRNWYGNMANGRDQLRQRMILALAQIFVLPDDVNPGVNPGANPDINPDRNAIHPWLAALSNNAFGNYKTLLLDMTLNLATRRDRYPGDHARALIESFTIGPVMLNQDGTVRLDRNGTPIPTDDAALIDELAAALATLAGADDGPRTILNGVALPAGLDAAIDMLFKHPNVPPFVATHLIRHFVTSEPSPGYVRRVAEAFAFGAGGRGDLKATLLAILTDLEAGNGSSTRVTGTFTAWEPDCVA